MCNRAFLLLLVLIALSTTIKTSPIPVVAQSSSTVRFVQSFLASGDSSSAILLEDLNGDTRPDIVVNDQTSKRPNVLLNATPPANGKVNFDPAIPVIIDEAFTAFAIGDINGDMRPDIVGSTNDDNAIRILLNTTPTGSQIVTWALSPAISIPDKALGLSIGDLNADGRADIAIGGLLGTLSILLNTTTSDQIQFASPQVIDTFRRFPADSISVAAVIMADFNGDTRLDIALSAGQPFVSAVYFLLNTTHQNAQELSFVQTRFETSGFHVRLTAGDIDHDSRIDVVGNTNRGTTDFVTTFLNRTSEGASEATFKLTSQTYDNAIFGATVADFDGDEHDDVAVSTAVIPRDNTANEQGRLHLFLSTTQSTSTDTSFAPEILFQMNETITNPVVGDLNGDNRLDIVLADADFTKQHRLSVLLNVDAFRIHLPSITTPSKKVVSNP